MENPKPDPPIRCPYCGAKVPDIDILANEHWRCRAEAEADARDYDYQRERYG